MAKHSVVPNRSASGDDLKSLILANLVHHKPVWIIQWLICVFAAIPFSGHTAGFDCDKARSASEKAVCASATLSSQDSTLATAWKEALANSSDKASLKRTQADWLSSRDDCGTDVTCLAQQYEARLGELRAVAAPSRSWIKTWKLDSDNPSVAATLEFTGSFPHLHFTLGASNGGHDGGLDGDVVVKGDTALFHSRAAGMNACELRFTRKSHLMLVAQKGDDGDCGAGMGVYYYGVYLTKDAFLKKPVPDLLTLRMLSDKNQDTAARRLLGTDYQSLVSTVNVCTSGDDLDHLAAEVEQCFVRGLASTNASLIMSKGSSLWVGLLVFDRKNQVRLRYYTNVPRFKNRIPTTIRTWRDAISPDIPIDTMP